MKNVLFIGLENSFASGIAASFAHIYGRQKINAASMGSDSSKLIQAKAEASMKMKGYDVFQKNIEAATEEKYDCIINIGCEENQTTTSVQNRKFWQIPNTDKLSMKELNVVRDLLEIKVKELLASI